MDWDHIETKEEYRGTVHLNKVAQVAMESRIAVDKLTEATELLLERAEAIEVKLVNLANKLEAHLKEPDAHHVAILAKRAQDG